MSFPIDAAKSSNGVLLEDDVATKLARSNQGPPEEAEEEEEEEEDPGAAGRRGTRRGRRGRLGRVIGVERVGLETEDREGTGTETLTANLEEAAAAAAALVVMAIIIITVLYICSDRRMNRRAICTRSRKLFADAQDHICRRSGKGPSTALLPTPL